MVMNNPFYVQPGGDFTQGLGQLSSAIRDVGKQRREEEAINATKERLGNFQTDYAEAQKSEDIPMAMSNLSIKYPEYNKVIMDSFGITNERSGNASVEAYMRAINDPQNAERYLTEGIEKVRSFGGSPTNLANDLKSFQENPEAALRNIELGLAQGAPRAYQAFRDMQPKPEEPVEYEYKEGGVIFNPRTGETKLAEARPDRKKTLKQVIGGVKYYTDGTEEAIGTTESVRNPITGKQFTQEQAQDVLANAKEFQLKNGGFAVTLGSNLDTVDRMYSEGYDPTKAAWVGAAFNDGAVANLLRSEEDQVFMGAIDEMINAIARRETGAAITEFERKDFFNRYMPRPGDSKKRLTQKRDALERQLKSIAGQSGGVYEALKITGDDSMMTPQQEAVESFVIESHPEYGNVSEADIQETMRANNMTREQVLSRLGAQ